MSLKGVLTRPDFLPQLPLTTSCQREEPGLNPDNSLISKTLMNLYIFPVYKDILSCTALHKMQYPPFPKSALLVLARFLLVSYENKIVKLFNRCFSRTQKQQMEETMGKKKSTLVSMGIFFILPACIMCCFPLNARANERPAEVVPFPKSALLVLARFLLV